MENPHSILLVEDEAKLGPIIRDELRRQGYLVDLAIDGKEAEEAFQNKLYSIVLLDVNLPYKSGLELCKEFRAANKTIPIIMLTAIGQIQDKVEAFDLGADDYLVKPFHFEELFVRVKALLKRTDKGHEDEKIIVDDLTIDMKNKSVVRAGMNINLTAK